MKKNSISLLFLIMPFAFYAQKIVVKDTVIDGIKYNYRTYYSDGKIKTTSQKKTENEKGAWLYFDEKGEEQYSGQFNKKGQKTGDWWYYRSEITYYKNGKIVKKGSGCKGCTF